MKFLMMLSLCINVAANTIINVSQKKELTRSELIKELASANVIVIGEKHYTEKIQIEEGRLIKDVVEYKNQFSKTSFSLGWEFLNASENTNIQKLVTDLRDGLITTDEFLFTTQKNQEAYVYGPMINETIKLNGQIIGVNLSRLEKAPVVKSGIGALDPKLLPPDFKEGGEYYFERFYDVMKTHASDDQIKNYFSAQSLVDDVSAYTVTQNNSDLIFLVIGAFHSMYNDGVVARLKDRAPLSKVLNIELIDVDDYTEDELKNLAVDPKYGARADYLILVRSL